MKKIVSSNGRDWYNNLYEALQADKNFPKRSIGMSPFELVYGINVQVSLSLNLAVVKLQTVIEDAYFQSSLEKRIMYLKKLEEERNKMVEKIIEHKMKVKKVSN